MPAPLYDGSAMEILVTADGSLTWRDRTVRCALGRGGVTHDKREGDGATPAGRYPLRRVFYRADRGAAPETLLPVQIINRDDGWCDDPIHEAYNTLVRLPFSAGHEIMWREDTLYDLVVEIGYNDAPPTPGAGSAIFLHVASADYTTTEGCVALAKPDLRELLATCDDSTHIVVTAPA